MMTVQLLIPIFNDQDEEKVCLEKVAGVPLIRRVALMSRRASLYCTLITLPGQDSTEIRRALAGTAAGIVHVDELPADGLEILTLILAAGFLPEADFFEHVRQDDLGAGMIIDRNELPVAWLGRRPEALASIVKQTSNTARLIEILAQAEQSPKVDVPESLGIVLRTPEDRIAAEERLLSALVKDTEGFISRHINRKISLAFSRRLMGTKVTPNQMTIMSTLIGLIGASLFLPDSYTAQLVGALLFLSHSILDGCDGELARLKLKESRLGGMLDFWSDNIVHVAVFACMGIGWSMSAHSTGPIVLAGLAVSATIVSAWIIFAHTMLDPAKSGPLYTSVSTSGPSALTRVADMLSRRDFIYLVVLLALLGQWHWFLVMTAIGTPLYAVMLLFILIRDRRTAYSGSTLKQ